MCSCSPGLETIARKVRQCFAGGRFSLPPTLSLEMIKSHGHLDPCYLIKDYIERLIEHVDIGKKSEKFLG